MTTVEDKQKASDELKAQLANYTGTTQWYRLDKKMLLTDGTKALAEAKPGHWWLMTLISSYQYKLKRVPFQVWNLKRTETKAVITCQADTDEPVLVRQEIPFTDTPLDKIKIFVDDSVILLPSEY